MKKSETGLMPQEAIEGKILLIRGKKVMLDRDLAMLYGVETKYLKQQVKRNIERFPDDFMYRLTKKELEEVSINPKHFTELLDLIDKKIITPLKAQEILRKFGKKNT